MEARSGIQTRYIPLAEESGSREAGGLQEMVALLTRAVSSITEPPYAIVAHSLGSAVLSAALTHLEIVGVPIVHIAPLLPDGLNARIVRWYSRPSPKLVARSSTSSLTGVSEGSFLYGRFGAGPVSGLAAALNFGKSALRIRYDQAYGAVWSGAVSEISSLDRSDLMLMADSYKGRDCFVLVGLRDPIQRHRQPEYFQAMFGEAARVEFLAGAGHAPYWTHPRETVELILDFVGIL